MSKCGDLKKPEDPHQHTIIIQAGVTCVRWAQGDSELVLGVSAVLPALLSALSDQDGRNP